MYDNQFLENMAFVGNYDTLRLQQELREKESEVERLKAKLKDLGSETDDVCCLVGVMQFLQRAIDSGEIKGVEPILIHDGNDYKLLSTRCRVSTIHAVTDGGKNPIKPLNGQRWYGIDKRDYLDKVIVFE